MIFDTQIVQKAINPRTDGGLGQLRTDGERMTAPPPEISKTKQRSEKRQTAFKTLEKVLPKVFRPFFAKVKNNVNRGHQRSNFTVIRLRPTFSDK